MKKPERRPRHVSNARANSTAVEPPSDKGALPSLIEIKELIELISNKQFNEFELQRGDFYIRVQISSNRVVSEVHLPGTQAANSQGNSSSPSAAAPAVVAPAIAAEEEKLHIISSPIVGTFYRSPDPTSEPFVKVGDQVENGQTLCIIEAMKLMNEIQSDAGGKITRVFVENGQPVEYGQRLFGLIV